MDAQQLKEFSDFLKDNRLFFIDEVRTWLRQYDREEISLSRFVELFHEKFFNWYQQNKSSLELLKNTDAESFIESRLEKFTGSIIMTKSKLIQLLEKYKNLSSPIKINL